MPKKKDGTKITWNEFFKLWKEGMQNITPIQRLTNESRGTFIILLGFIVGTVALFVFMDKFPVGLFTWALILIFVGNTWTTSVRWLGLKQQLKAFKNMDVQSINVDKIFDSLEDENKIKELEKRMKETSSGDVVVFDEASNIKEEKNKDEK